MFAINSKIQKYISLIISIFIATLITSFFFYPAYSRPLSFAFLSLSIGSAIFFTVHRHWRAYKQGETPRGQMLKNLTLDLLGLGLTLATAIFVGRLAGGYFGVRAGFWVGILAGFAGGFAATWVVRSGWEKLAGC